MAAVTHHLKSHPKHYGHVAAGSKLFDIRKDDRHYLPGDVLILEEYDPTRFMYTGRKSVWVVNCVLENHPGVKRGYVAMSLTPHPHPEKVR